MKSIKQILSAATLALAIGTTASAGDISGGRAIAINGDISGGKAAVAGDISAGRAGDISGGRAGDISGGFVDLALLFWSVIG